MQKECAGTESKSETEALLRKALTDYLKKKENPALLPIQIAYYTGLRIGEVCALTWQDIDLREQTITVRRSMRYNGARHKMEVGTTKRSKIRTVDFCDTLAAILKAARTEQHKNRFKYGELYSLNYYRQVQEERPQLLRAVQSAKVGGSAGGLPGDRLRLPPPGWVF